MVYYNYQITRDN